MTPGLAVDFCMMSATEQRPPLDVPKLGVRKSCDAELDVVFATPDCAAARTWQAPAVEALAI